MEIPSSHFERYLERVRPRIDQALDDLLPPARQEPRRLSEAIRYSVFAGGKRLRPALCILACESCGGRARLALPAAAALEMIHTFSLIHDDLPGMDDDNWRRGRPTNHRVFGEGIAILAGDALLSIAFETLASRAMGRAAGAAALIRTICDATGPRGMIGGQALDLLYERRPVSLRQVLSMHRRKTGMLFRASLLLGAQIGGAGTARLRALDSFGDRIGVAFQIVDDLLNVRSTRSRTGKSVGSDRVRGKATAPSAAGESRADAHACRLLLEAASICPRLGSRAREFASLTTFIRSRRS